ncbi:protein kinase [Streptomyces sp. NPDC091268]|uniref:serine/threonine-protein kinase n=1 Tax=Streptomyces sp. NPDC091268 TaxID=3365979 RepID=UPI0037FC939C
MVELNGSGAAPLEAEDPPRIGPIPLAGRLGAGGMGRVYLGVQDGRYVAVKQLLSSVVGEDPDFLRRFGHELDNLARLPAGATAPLLAGDRTARPPWFATAYIPGITLREALDLNGGPLPAGALWVLLREAAAGLASVHALDMVHRDLKPSNVMLTLDGLTLIDFGVARAAEQSQLTRTGMVVGTPAYMAPEQASGTKGLSGATDVFALGSVLAYAACGKPPFGEESGHGVLYRIVHEEPDLGPLREAEPELAELVAACLDKDPEGRPTAAELLEHAVRRGPAAAPPWPAAVSARLSERAAFAAHVQEIDVPTAPLTGTQPPPAPGPVPEADAAIPPGVAGPPAAAPAAAVRPQRPERRRRTSVLLAVLPVVVVAGGTTLAIQLLPHTSPLKVGAQPDPSASGSGAAGATPPTGSTGPATAQSPSPGAAGETPGGKEQTAASGAQNPASGAGGAGPGTGNGANAGAGPGSTTTGTGTGNGTGTGTGTGTSKGTGSGTPGGAGPSGGGGTSTAPKPTPPADSGTYRYGNGSNGKCITQVYGSADFGSCSDATARWTVQSRSDGTFKLVNQQSGSCLYSNGLGQAVFVGDCAQDVGRLWRTGASGSLRSEYGGGCLDLPMSQGLVTNTCGGQASQRWTRQ